MKNLLPLAPHVLDVLLALADGQSNGYEIRQAAGPDSNGIVELTSGAVYPALQRLVSHGYIQEVGSGSRSHAYKLTKTGWWVSGLELERLERAVKSGKEGLSVAGV